MNRGKIFLPISKTTASNSSIKSRIQNPSHSQEHELYRRIQLGRHHLLQQCQQCQQYRLRSSQSSRTWLDRQSKDPYVLRAQEENWPSRAAFKLQEINEIHFPTLMAKENKNKKKSGGSRHKHNNRQTLIQPSMCILDLGAAPGGWSLYSSTQLDSFKNGAVVAVDLLPLDENLQMQSTDVSSRIIDNMNGNFEFIQGDFTTREVHYEIMEALSRVGNNTKCSEEEELLKIYRRADLVLSDMAPNFTGDSLTDALRTINLCEQALAFAVGHECFDQSYSKQKAKKEGDSGILVQGGAFLCKYFACGQENERDLMDATKRAFRKVHVIKPKASRKESSEIYLLGLDYLQ